MMVEEIHLLLKKRIKFKKYIKMVVKKYIKENIKNKQELKIKKKKLMKQIKISKNHYLKKRNIKKIEFKILKMNHKKNILMKNKINILNGTKKIREIEKEKNNIQICKMKEIQLIVIQVMKFQMEVIQMNSKDQNKINQNIIRNTNNKINIKTKIILEKKKENKKLEEIKMKMKNFIVYLKVLIYKNQNKITAKVNQKMIINIDKRKTKKE